MTNEKGKGSFNGLMGNLIKVGGSKESSTVKGNSLNLTGKSRMENGKMGEGYGGSNN